VVCSYPVGPVNRVWVLCVGRRRLFYNGIRVDAYPRIETAKVCCIVDCWEYSFSLQVCPLSRLGGNETSFAALQGPVPYIKHLMSPARLPFTAAYFGSLGFTLYFSVGVMSCFLSVADIS
jgi:hypothetical protein